MGVREEQGSISCVELILGTHADREYLTQPWFLCEHSFLSCGSPDASSYCCQSSGIEGICWTRDWPVRMDAHFARTRGAVCRRYRGSPVDSSGRCACSRGISLPHDDHAWILDTLFA